MSKTIIIVYLLIINAAAFLLMGADKKKARQKTWRISEKTLFSVAAIGGSVGAILGMWTFHHKTKHWYFVIGMPVLLAIQIGIGFLLKQ